MKNWNKSSIKIYRTLAEDTKCKPLSFLPIDNQVKRAGLISHPGSGNTWTRHLIEQATGIYTGSVYDNDRLYCSGRLISCQTTNIIGCFGHFLQRQTTNCHFENFGKAKANRNKSF